MDALFPPSRSRGRPFGFLVRGLVGGLATSWVRARFLGARCSFLLEVAGSLLVGVLFPPFCRLLCTVPRFPLFAFFLFLLRPPGVGRSPCLWMGHLLARSWLFPGSPSCSVVPPVPSLVGAVFAPFGLPLLWFPVLRSRFALLCAFASWGFLVGSPWGWVCFSLISAFSVCWPRPFRLFVLFVFRVLAVSLFRCCGCLLRFFVWPRLGASVRSRDGLVFSRFSAFGGFPVHCRLFLPVVSPSGSLRLFRPCFASLLCAPFPCFCLPAPVPVPRWLPSAFAFPRCVWAFFLSVGCWLGVGGWLACRLVPARAALCSVAVPRLRDRLLSVLWDSVSVARLVAVSHSSGVFLVSVRWGFLFSSVSRYAGSFFFSPRSCPPLFALSFFVCASSSLSSPRCAAPR